MNCSVTVIGPYSQHGEVGACSIATTRVTTDVMMLANEVVAGVAMRPSDWKDEG